MLVESFAGITLLWTVYEQFPDCWEICLGMVLTILWTVARRFSHHSSSQIAVYWKANRAKKFKRGGTWSSDFSLKRNQFFLQNLGKFQNFEKIVEFFMRKNLITPVSYWRGVIKEMAAAANKCVNWLSSVPSPTRQKNKIKKVSGGLSTVLGDPRRSWDGPERY